MKTPQLQQIRHFLLDLDGTLYLGHRLFAQTPNFLQTLADRGIGRSFFTNNSSRSTREYVSHLQAMGIEAKSEEICSSTNSTIDYLRDEHPQIERLFVLGTPGLVEDFTRAGYDIWDEDAGHEPDAVIIGFDTTLTYRRLSQAAYWISRGKLYVATHRDLICPTDQPTVLPDCGSICQLLNHATGRQPDAVLGKPHPRMLSCVMRGRELSPENVAVVGDRLYTDMAMAQSSGAMSILVLSGETTPEQAQGASPKPDLIVQDIGELARQLTALLDTPSQANTTSGSEAPR